MCCVFTSEEQIDSPVKMHFPLGIGHIYIINCQSFPYIMQLLITLAEYWVGERAHTMHKYLTWYFKTSGWTWCVYRSLSSSHSRSVFQPSFLSLASSLSISPPNSIRTQLHSFAHKIYRVSLRERFHHFKVCVCSIFLRGGKFMDNALAHNNFKCVYNEHFGRAMLTLGFVQF